MIKAATGRVTGPSGQWPLGSAGTRAAGARAALAFAPCICSSPSIRRMPRPFGGALAATRPQQQARLVTGAAAAAAAPPQGDDGILGLRCGGAAQGSTGRSKTAASASAITDADANASAVAAAHLLRGALEAALLPRLDAIKGDMCAMEERIVQRVEAQVAALRSELLMALWEKEDAAKQQQPAAAAEIAALRCEIQALAARQQEWAWPVAAATAAVPAAAGTTQAATEIQSGFQPSTGEPAWLGRLWEFVQGAAIVICLAVYASIFLGAVITFFTTCANMDMTLTDKMVDAIPVGVVAIMLGAPLTGLIKIE